MEQEKAMTAIKTTNRHKVEDILLMIDGNVRSEAVKERHKNYYVHEVSGQINEKVTFTGERYSRYTQENHFDPDFKPHAELELQANGKKLSSISMQYKFGSGKKWHYPKINGAWKFCEETLVPLKNITKITVTSPAWNEQNGVATVTGIGRKKLSILHGQNETAQAVIEKVYNEVIGNQNKMEKLKRLREINSTAESVTNFFNGLIN